MEDNKEQSQIAPGTESKTQPGQGKYIQQQSTGVSKNRVYFLSIALIVFFLLAASVAGYFGYKNYVLKNTITITPPPPNPTLRPTDIHNITISPIISQTERKVPKVKKEFILTIFGGYTYKLSWLAYDICNNHNCSNLDFNSKEYYANINTLVSLVRVKSGIEEIVVEQIRIPLHSSNPDGLFKIITNPQGSSKVLIESGTEGTGGWVRYLVDVTTGKLTDYMNNLGGDCQQAPFYNTQQRFLIASCSVQPTNNETLYKYDLVSEITEVIDTADTNQTYKCGSYYDHAFSFKYSDSNTLSIDKCNKSNTDEKESIVIKLDNK